MKLTSYSRASLLAISTLAAIWAAGCSDEDPAGTEGAGGTDVGGAGGAGGKATGVGGKATGGANVGGGTVAQGGGVVGGSTNGGATGVGGGTLAQGGVTGGGAGTGGATSAGAGGTVTAGAGGKAVAGNAGSGTAGQGCGTTPSTFPATTTTFATDVAGFAINTANSPNPGKALTQLTDATIGGGMCSGGCAVITGTFAAGDATWGNGVIVEKPFSAATNLVGAKIVVQLAIDNPNSTPIQFKVFAQTGTPDWAWAEKGTTAIASLSLATGVHTYEYPLVDVPGTGTAKTFCASAVFKYGFQIQTTDAAVTTTTAGTVKVYIQSVSIVPPGGTIGGTGGAAGAAGATSTGTAGAGTAGGGGTAGATGTTDVAGSAGTAGSN